MNCQDCRDLFSAYLDRELSGRENAELAIHALSCVRCEQELRDLLEMKRLLNSQPLLTMPEELRGQIAAATYAKPSWRQNITGAWQWIPALVLAAALGGWWLVRLHKLPARGAPVEGLMAQQPSQGSTAALVRRERLALHRDSDTESTSARE